MKRMTINKFQAECESVLDHMGPDGVLITKNGKPIARVLPAVKSPRRLIGSLKKKMKIKGNILSTGLAWDAES